MLRYTTIQGDLGGKSIFWNVEVSAVVRKKVNMRTCLNCEWLSRLSCLYLHTFR